MKFNKKIILGVGVFSTAMLVGCGGGGGDEPTEKKETGITVGLKDETRKLFYGDKLNKDDFEVKVTYSDGSTSVASTDKYKIYTGGPISPVEITFPYSIEFENPSSYALPKSFMFQYDGGKYWRTASFNIEKKYYFEYGDRLLNSFAAYDVKNKTIENLLTSSETITGKVTYTSNKEDEGIKVNADTGEVTFNYTGDKMPKSFISAFVDGICVDKYYLEPFDSKIGDMELSYGMSVGLPSSYTTEQRKAYNPNGNGILDIPDIWGDSFVTHIGDGKSDFKNCEAITTLYLPNSINVINPGSFKDCININNTVIIPGGVSNIGENAFSGTTNAKFEFSYINEWYYSSSEGKSGAIAPEWIENKDNATTLIHYVDLNLYNWDRLN